MSGITDYAQNKIKDAVWRGQALGAPATFYFALIIASKGERANSTAYALNDTVVVKVGGKYAFYKCTTAGTTAAALPAYLAAAGEAIADGTAAFTEQTAALGAGTYTEAAGNAYARAPLAASLANFSGTQGAGTTVASAGSDGSTSNNVAINFPTSSGVWHPAGSAIVGVVAFDAVAAGNAWHWALLGSPQFVSAAAVTPAIAAGTWSDRLGD